MTTRCSKTRAAAKTVIFNKPFALGGIEGEQPADVDRVETDEELLEGALFAAYRRVLAVLHLHARPDHPGAKQILTISPGELEAALQSGQV